VYASILCAVSFATGLMMRDTRRFSRIVED
jgi:hypothetical protein